jgi:ATP-dependent protease ClpP protease subunit
MDIYWGIQQNNDNTCEKKDNILLGKRKFFEMDDELIYSFGTEVHFTGPIDKNTIATVIKEITKVINEKNNVEYDKDKKFTVCYIVDSPGGCVTSVLKFVDFLNIVRQKHPNVEFVSIGTGLIASAGTIMCAVADKRYMTSNSYAMIHELSSGNVGKFTHLVSYTKYLSQMHDRLVDIYLQKSSMKKKEIEALLKDESWFSAQEYLKKGLIDDIK